MKKNITFLVSSFVAALFCVMAFADGLGPDIRETECKVTNPLGTYLYYTEYNEDTEEHEHKKLYIPFGTEIIVRGSYEVYEYDEEDEWSYKQLDGKKSGYVRNYKDKHGYIVLDDVAVVDEDFPETKIEKLPAKKTYYVMNEAGVSIYKGPSTLYDKVGSIPYGKEFTVEYVDKAEDDSDSDMDYWGASFGYTEYNGVKGWVYIYKYINTDVAVKIDENDPYLGKVKVMDKGVYLVDFETTDEGYLRTKEITKEIPVGTELTFKYYFTPDMLIYALTEYNGTKGYLNIFMKNDAGPFGILIYFKGYMFAGKDMQYYPDCSKNAKRIYPDIPEGAILKITGSVEFGSYEQDYSENYIRTQVEYNGKTYWISDRCYYSYYGGNMIGCEYNNIMKYDGKNIPVYSKNDKNSEQIGTLKKGDKITVIACNWNEDNSDYCIIKDGRIGWVLKDLEYDYDENTPVPYSDTYDVLTKEYLRQSNVIITETETTSEETTVAETEIETETETEISTVEETESIPEEIEEALDESSPNSIIIYCVIGAVILAATAGACIVLIRKKKKSEE